MRRGEFKDEVGMAYFKIKTCNKELYITLTGSTSIQYI